MFFRRAPPTAPDQRRDWLGRPVRPRATRLRWFLVRWLLVALSWGSVALACLFAWVTLALPDIADLAGPPHPPSIAIMAADGSLVANYGELRGDRIRLADLPPALPQALIATEDRRFYDHPGIDPLGMARALVADLAAGHVVQGGSTITQQLAKNLFLTPDRTLVRKLQEALLALRLEQRFGKDEILEIYLNRVYFGAGAYGVDAAARRYFGIPARSLTLYQSALLAGLVKAPSALSPVGYPARAAARTAQVLQNMVAAGYLTATQAAEAVAAGTRLAPVEGTRPGLRYFADWIEDQAASSGYGGDLIVTTTLDPRLQALAEATIEQSLARDGKRAAASQAALIAMSPDGAVRAMVGGRDYRTSQFNRATQAARQPGSAFKPFVYLAGLEHGMSPDDRFTDQPIRVGDWSPRDYAGQYQGEISMADALAQSINSVAVEIALKVGLPAVVATARRLGITAHMRPEASLALGSAEVTLIDLTGAYCAFASGGIGAWPHGLLEIRDPAGRLLYRRSGGGPGRVIEPGPAAAMNGMLEGVIGHGTGRAAALGRPAAGKTGTTSDYRDALFVGYTADLVAGVWFGNDDNAPMSKVTGGSLPARAWHDFMAAATADVPPRALPRPAEDAFTALLARLRLQP